MRQFIVSFALLASGCLVPVQVPCFGSECDAGTDASTPACSGVVTPSWHPAPGAVGPVQLSFDGCGSEPIVVVSPDGSTIPAAISVVNGQTQLSFETSQPGVYTVTVGSGATQHATQVDVYELQDLDAGILRTYVDRVDTCGLLTLEGRLVCPRGSEIWVYEVDGGIHGHFPGEEPRVSDNVVWSIVNGAVERRVDGPSGLQLESRLDGLGLMNNSSTASGETTASHTLRSGSARVVDIAWDGGLLSAREFYLSLTSTFAFLDGDQVWVGAGGEVCEHVAGCQATLCSPTVTCPFSPKAMVVGLNADKVWLSDWDTGPHFLTMRTRPLRSSVQGALRPVPLAVGAARAFSLTYGGAGFALSPGSTTVEFIQPSDGGSTYFRVMSEPVTANTERWVVTTVNPHTLRVTPH